MDQPLTWLGLTRDSNSMRPTPRTQASPPQQCD